MTSHRNRVISLVLNDEEWKALVEAQPQPVEWLHRRITELIGATSESAQPQADEGYTTFEKSH